VACEDLDISEHGDYGNMIGVQYHVTIVPPTTFYWPMQMMTLALAPLPGSNHHHRN
jgi:hypothetical protein